MDTTNLIDTYDYDLPLNRIAEYPLANRDESKLLIYKNKTIIDGAFKTIVETVPRNALLVFNNTRVVQARFLFYTETGAQVEVFSLEPAEGGPAESMSTKELVVWKCFVGNAKRWKQPILERSITIESGKVLVFRAKQIERKEDYYIIEFNWNIPERSFSEIFTLLGDLPLPPYMKRKTEESDKERYQTVYAKHEGSVAAPTAGLHFTDTIIESLHKKGIALKEVTLHVGAGTFKPVKTDSILEHTMHGEYISVTKEFIEYLIEYLHSKCIIPVGTTSMRTLESLYWLGCKLKRDSKFKTVLPELEQWDAYSIEPISVEESLQSILVFLQSRGCSNFEARTSLLIKPGYVFKMCNALITNFHQPKSTLLCLVASFIGIEEMKRLYTFAMEHDYRFLSYGDSSILFKNHKI
jgi:S-adenosylmethionine:tRNA ribosyltransferase-isomerase